jgi:hypothetical protein
MNKEDKLKIVERSIKGTKEYIEEIKENLKNGILHNKKHRKWLKTLLERQEYQLEVFKRELKLLQIQPRTIENLQVGDYIFLQFTQGLVVAVDDYEFEIVTRLGSHENISYHPSLKYKITPHEFLELWGEINDNIQTAI